MSDGIVLVLADVVSDKKPYASIFTSIARTLFVYLVRNPVGFGIILGLLTLALIVTGFVFYSKRKAQRNNESVKDIKQWVLKVLPVGIVVALVVCVVSVIFSPLNQVENNVVYRTSSREYVRRDDEWFVMGHYALLGNDNFRKDIAQIKAEPWKYYVGRFDESDENKLASVKEIGDHNESWLQ